ncbi:MAG: signal peptidase I [Treponema sp.]|nr:signal peptidase I [Treponema sp.]
MKPFLKKYVLFGLFWGVIIGVFLKFFVLDILKVEGVSMEPAFKDKSSVFVNKLAYGLDIPFGDSQFLSWSRPKVGDVVVFMKDGNLVVKRCAAISGMPLDYSFDSGYNLSAGGKSYSLTALQYHLLVGNDHVPDGTILAIGDNEAKSIDSRDYGFVPEKNILGRIICR